MLINRASRQGWRSPNVIGTAIIVQLLNVLIWNIFSRMGYFCPSIAPYSAPVSISECPNVFCEPVPCIPSVSLNSNKQNMSMSVSTIKSKYPSLVENIKQEQSPFAFTSFWGEMHQMVKLRHGIRSLRGAHYEQVMRISMFERERILEQYYRNRADVTPIVREIVEKIKIDNTIILMAFNYGSLVLFFNWICSCRRANISVNNLLVVSADEKTHFFLSSMNISSLFLPKFFGEYQTEGVKAFGTPEWNPFGRLKILVPKLILEMEVNILFQDVDVIWFKNPLALMRSAQFSDYDFVIQHVGRNRPMFGPFYGNSGLFYMKGNAHVQACWDRLFFDLDKIASWSGSQQMILNYHLGLCAAPNAPLALRVKYVDPSIFPSGWVAQNGTMKDALIEKNELYEKFVLYHTNWAVNTAEKIQANQKYHIWFLSPKVHDKTDPESLGQNFCEP